MENSNDRADATAVPGIIAGGWRLATTRCAAGVLAAFAVGVSTPLLIAGPAGAAPAAEADIELKAGGGDGQGKAGSKITVSFDVTNHGKVDVGVAVGIRVPANAELDPADYPAGRCTLAANHQQANCRLAAAVKAGQSVNGAFQVVLRTAGDGAGAITASLSPPTQTVIDPKPANNTDGFKVHVIGGPSPSPSVSKSPSAKASRSASAAPTQTPGSAEVIAPPEASNGALPKEDDPKKTVSNDQGGFSAGIWIGGAAIVAALGLVGSLFYFRRKDRLEPETGVFTPPERPAFGGDNATAVIPAGTGVPRMYGTPATPPAAGFAAEPPGGGFPPAGGPPSSGGFPPAGGPPSGGGFPPAGGSPSGGGFPSAGNFPPAGGVSSAQDWAPAVPPPIVPLAAVPPPLLPPPALPPPVAPSAFVPPAAVPPPAVPPPAVPPPAVPAPPVPGPAAGGFDAGIPPFGAGGSAAGPESGPAAPPAGPPAGPSGANDETIIMRRPDGL